MKILILGGTEEARELAGRLVAMGHEVVTSLAGRTSEPLMPAGKVRIGGFGGAEALGTFLRREKFDRVLDATHPYAVQMHTNAVLGAEMANLRLVRFLRQPWQEPPDVSWVQFTSDETAAETLPQDAHVFLTVGQKQLATYLERRDCRFLVRSIEPLERPLPGHATHIVGRPPFYPGGEAELMERFGITHLVTKNSGGVQTEAKLQAAQQRGIEVYMILRPELAPAYEVHTVGQAIAALRLAIAA